MRMQTNNFNCSSVNNHARYHDTAVSGALTNTRAGILFIILFFSYATASFAENDLNQNHPTTKPDIIDRIKTDDAPAISSIDELRNNLVDIANSLDEIIATPVTPEQYIAEEEAVLPVTRELSITRHSNTTTIPEKVVTTNREIIQSNPVAIKLIAPDTLSEISEPIIKSTAIKIEEKTVYKKYDIDGNLVETETEQWACIHDTSNNLMWEVKSKNDNLRNPNNLYSWFDPTNKNLKGKADGGRCKGDTDCDTNAYVQAMNEKNFCGYNDWHLPTRVEMQTLVQLNKQNDPVKIDKQYFPETLPSWYWTASENNEKNNFAWYVLFRSGIALNDLKERPKHIRLVRNNTQ